MIDNPVILQSLFTLQNAVTEDPAVVNNATFGSKDIVEMVIGALSFTSKNADSKNNVETHCVASSTIKIFQKIFLF